MISPGGLVGGPPDEGDPRGTTPPGPGSMSPPATRRRRRIRHRPGTPTRPVTARPVTVTRPGTAGRTLARTTAPSLSTGRTTRTTARPTEPPPGTRPVRPTRPAPTPRSSPARTRPTGTSRCRRTRRRRSTAPDPRTGPGTTLRADQGYYQAGPPPPAYYPQDRRGPGPGYPQDQYPAAEYRGPQPYDQGYAYGVSEGEEFVPHSGSGAAEPGPDAPWGGLLATGPLPAAAGQEPARLRREPWPVPGRCRSALPGTGAPARLPAAGRPSGRPSSGRVRARTGIRAAARSPPAADYQPDYAYPPPGQAGYQEPGRDHGQPVSRAGGRGRLRSPSGRVPQP